MKALKIISLILVIVGGLNWGLVGLFDFNLVSTIFGDATAISRVVYILVGLAAVLLIFLSFQKGKKVEQV